MATIRFTARRGVVALGIAAAMAVAPFVAAPHVLAEPGECTTSSEPGDASLDCAPAFVPEIGAPSEMELTDTNPGIGSPEHSHH